MNQELAIIKKKYGEKMMQLCRTMFPTLLDEPGLLSNILLTNFEPTKFLYDDIIANNCEEQFKNYIYSFIDVENNNEIKNIKTPKELLEEAGYILYECNTEEDIQSFRKYYAESEELCTFNGGRLERCHVFFAVKKNVDEIKRENFPNPERQDEYGTSVISIQFSKGEQNTLSIKNRYNHRVNNPDATFSNNLDNIIEGLTESFEREYNLNLENQKHGLEIPGYVKANDGKYYKYNYEINNIYYCPNNIIIDNFNVIDTYREKEKYIVSDYFIIDLVNKKIELYDREIKDSFVDGLQNISKIRVINSKEYETKTIEIEILGNKNIIIVLDKKNQIIKYDNENLLKIRNGFLNRNITLIELNLPNLEEVGDDFVYSNEKISKINLPRLKKTGILFLCNASELTELNLPILEEAGDYFNYWNRKISKINFPNLKKAGIKFIKSNEKITELNLPKLEEVGDYFLLKNKCLTELNFPNLKKAGSYFIEFNRIISKLNLPNLEEVGENFLGFNENLTELNLPNLKEIGDNFVLKNKKISKLNLPKTKKTGNSFLYNNEELKELSLPKLEEIGSCFLFENKKLTILNVPNLNLKGDYFFYNNKHINSYKITKTKQIKASLSKKINNIIKNLKYRAKDRTEEKEIRRR